MTTTVGLPWTWAVVMDHYETGVWRQERGIGSRYSLLVLSLDMPPRLPPSPLLGRQSSRSHGVGPLLRAVSE